jgi:hypothetical protein
VDEEPKRAAKDNSWCRLAMLNRETWNRWMAPRLSDERKTSLREKGWSDTELTPFSESEQHPESFRNRVLLLTGTRGEA